MSETINDTINGNRLIVEFMNGEIDNGQYFVTDSYKDENGEDVFKYVKGKAYVNFSEEKNQYEKVMPVSDLQYHSSWDWLMPVVKKALSYLSEYPYTTEHMQRRQRFYITLKYVDIDLLFMETVRFIKWYNESK